MKLNIFIFIVLQVAIMASCNPSALIPFEELREVPRELEGQVVFSVGGSLLEVESGTKALPVVIENLWCYN